MYEAHYGLTAPPFQLNPDPSFYFGSKGHRSAHDYLRFGVYQGEGFIVVTGEIGAGKTTLVRTLHGELDPLRVVAAQLVSTHLDASDLLRAVATAFGIPIKGATKAEMLGSLEAFLMTLATENRRALLIVDEAQNLTLEAIEELRMLSNFQLGNRALLQSFLIGQPELRMLLRSPKMEQLRQRVIASCHLGPMDRAETAAYIEHRLHCVGWNNDPVFETGAYDAIYRATGGVPRKINLLCNRILLSAFLDDRHVIGQAMAEEAARESFAESGTGGLVAQPIGSPADLNRGPMPNLPSPFMPSASSAVDKPAAQDEAANSNTVTLSAQTAPDGSVPQPAVDPHASPASQNDPAAVTRDEGERERLARIAEIPPGALLCIVSSAMELKKMVPLVHALDLHPSLPAPVLVHTGVADDGESEPPTQDLGDLPEPHVYLGVHGGSSVYQTAEIMRRFEPVLETSKPLAVIVSGNLDASLACSLTAKKMGVSVAQIDAELSPLDGCPSLHVNRVLTHQLCDVLYSTRKDATEYLSREGIPQERVHFVGNLSTDMLSMQLPQATAPIEVLRRASLPENYVTGPNGYAVVVLDDASTFDNSDTLAQLVKVLRKAGKLVPIIWPLPQARYEQCEEMGILSILKNAKVTCLAGLSAPEMLGLIAKATYVLTDSANIQEQTSALGVPCLTLRSARIHDLTVDQGSNTLVDGTAESICAQIDTVLSSGGKRGRKPEFWDGRTATRITEQLASWLQIARDDHNVIAGYFEAKAR